MAWQGAEKSGQVMVGTQQSRVPKRQLRLKTSSMDPLGHFRYSKKLVNSRVISHGSALRWNDHGW